VTEMIVIKKLRKTYALGASSVTALDGVNLEIGQGEFVAIVGSSGSGKSTLMNMIGGLDRPDGGEVSINGENIARMPVNQLAEFRNSALGFVFQSFQLMPRQSALSNVALPLSYRRPKISNAKQLAHDSLQTVGLGDRIDHKPTQLSGGQQQRVAIARALVGSPILILADEPTGALDSKTSDDIMNLFVSLSNQGRTIIIVTHDTGVAAYAKRIITMSDGRVLHDIQNK